MVDLLSRVDGGNLAFIISLAALLLFGLISYYIGVWYTLRRSEIEAELKREMIQKGMSADEITQVLNARMK